MTSEPLYRRAVEKWGPAQLDMAIEECAELIKAICDHKRNRVGMYSIVEEVVDVEIMCGQLRCYVERAGFGVEQIDQVKAQKLARLKKRLDE